MDTGYLILIAVFLAGTGYLMRRYEPLRETIVIWLYLLSGGLALYSVETADAGQPLHITTLTALLLCLVPAMIDGLSQMMKAVNTSRILRKHMPAVPKDCGGH